MSGVEEQASLLRVLINCAEKAANIARICRSNEQLLALLVQEKIGSEANERFEHDFKTLADVLIQETIKHEVGALFPAMKDAILGEESPNFTNQLGESVTIAVGATEEDTAASAGSTQRARGCGQCSGHRSPSGCQLQQRKAGRDCPTAGRTGLRQFGHLDRSNWFVASTSIYKDMLTIC